jgi:hypothetical protein
VHGEQPLWRGSLSRRDGPLRPVRLELVVLSAKGATLLKVGAHQIEIRSGEDRLSRYGSREFSKHFSCNRCGIHVFTRISRSAASSVVLNLACVDEVGLGALSPRVFDGANLL